MDYLLLIDTTSKLCSVAVSKNDVVIALKESDDEFDHSSKLTLFINEVIALAGIELSDLSAVAISAGPGSYTGLRIGTATAKGLCYALDIPLIAVDTLFSLAKAATVKGLVQPNELIVPVIDSRKDEIYTAVLDQNGNYLLQSTPADLASHPFDKLLHNYDLLFVGHAINKVRKHVKHKRARYSDEIVRSSVNLAIPAYKSHQIKAHKNLIYFEPLYLKDVFIKVKSD